jgi:hypothetical protein
MLSDVYSPESYHMRNGRKISKKPASILLFLCVLVLIPAGIVCPQEKPLLVAIELMAPCVMKSDGAYTGFERIGALRLNYERKSQGIWS